MRSESRSVLSHASSPRLSRRYDDVERARARKKADEEAAKAARRKRHAEENDARAARGEEAVAYDEWEKAEDAKKKEADDAAKKERDAAERARDEARRKARLERDSTPEYIDDAELDLKDVRGYKTLADGRRVCYYYYYYY